MSLLSVLSVLGCGKSGDQQDDVGNAAAESALADIKTTTITRVYKGETYDVTYPNETQKCDVETSIKESGKEDHAVKVCIGELRDGTFFEMDSRGDKLTIFDHRDVPTEMGDRKIDFFSIERYGVESGKPDTELYNKEKRLEQISCLWSFRLKQGSRTVDDEVVENKPCPEIMGQVDRVQEILDKYLFLIKDIPDVNSSSYLPVGSSESFLNRL